MGEALSTQSADIRQRKDFDFSPAKDEVIHEHEGVQQ